MGYIYTQLDGGGSATISSKYDNFPCLERGYCRSPLDRVTPSIAIKGGGKNRDGNQATKEGDMGKTLFMLTRKQRRSLEPLFKSVRQDNALDQEGCILLQPHYDGRVIGAYINQAKAEKINATLRGER